MFIAATTPYISLTQNQAFDIAYVRFSYKVTSRIYYLKIDFLFFRRKIHYKFNFKNPELSDHVKNY